MGANDKAAATFHPFDPPRPEFVKAITDQVNRLLADPTIQAAIAGMQARAVMPSGLAQAVSEWDRALDDAEVEYDEALWSWRAEWLTTGRWEITWRMWARLTPGLTDRDVLAAGQHIASCRFLCDWTYADVARVQVALLEGWQTRQLTPAR